MPRFVLFGLDHLAALGVTALAGAVLARFARTHRDGTTGRLVRWGLAAGLIGLAGLEVRRAIEGGWAQPEYLCPLHLCDLAMLLAIYTLLSLDRRAGELLYFWAGAGTTVAMLTPDVAVGFPRWEFFVFFGLHGLVVVSALVLTFGFGLAPGPGAPWRAFAATVAYSALVGLVNALWGTNFMFLRAKPGTPTLLDVMGPWPVYILVGAALALVLFQLLGLPFRRAWRSARS